MDSLRHGAATTQRKGGRRKKKWPHAELRKRIFPSYIFFFPTSSSSSSSLMERMRGFLAGATTTTTSIAFFYIQISSVVVVGGKNKKQKIEEEKGGKQRSLSGMNDPRFIFSKLIDRITTLIAPTSINSNRVARQKAQKKRRRRKFRNLHLDIRFHQTNVFAWSAVRVVPTPVKCPTAFSLKNK